MLTKANQVSLNISYYLLLSPVRILISNSELKVLSTHNTKIALISSLPQRLCCGFLTCLGIVSYALKNYKPIKTRNPIDHFQNLATTLAIVVAFFLVHHLWFHPRRIKSILELLDTIPEQIKPPETFWLGKVFVSISCILFYVLAIVSGSKHAIENFKSQSTTYTEIVLTVGRIHFFLLNSFAGIFYTVKILSLWLVTQRFSIFIQNSRNVEVYKFLDYYLTAIHSLANQINQVCGNMVGCHILIFVLYFAINENVLTEGGSYMVYGSILELIYLVLSFLQLILMADVHREGTQLQKWLFVKENRKLVQPPWDVVVILDQVNSCEIAVKAGNVIPVTYGVIVSVSTYAKVNMKSNLMSF